MFVYYIVCVAAYVYVELEMAVITPLNYRGDRLTLCE